MKKYICLLIVAVLTLGACGCVKSEKAQDNLDVTKIYNDFLNGKAYAYSNNESITIENVPGYIKPEDTSYALFDRNGDSVPELCINNGDYPITFWVNDGKLMLWHEGTTNTRILKNGNTLMVNSSYNSNSYSYLIHSYDGRVTCDISIIENLNENSDNTYYFKETIIGGTIDNNAIEITKKQFDSRLSSFEKIGDAELNLKTIK